MDAVKKAVKKAGELPAFLIPFLRALGLVSAVRGLFYYVKKGELIWEMRDYNMSGQILQMFQIEY